MMATEIIRITDDATRAEIALAIAELRRRYERLPVHFVDQRKVLADEVEALVDDWLAASE